MHIVVSKANAFLAVLEKYFHFINFGEPEGSPVLELQLGVFDLADRVDFLAIVGDDAANLELAEPVGLRFVYFLLHEGGGSHLLSALLGKRELVTHVNT